MSTYLTTVYDNLWIVDIGIDHRARELTKYWTDRSAPTGT